MIPIHMRGVNHGAFVHLSRPVSRFLRPLLFAAACAGLSEAVHAQQEIILDNTASSGVTVIGTWTASTSTAGYYGTDYLHDGNIDKGAKSVRFAPTLPASGNYDVYARWTAHSNRASNVPIDITYSGGSDQVQVSQRAGGGAWVLLGTYNFAAGNSGSVLISNAGTNGYVIADAVRFVASTSGQVAAPVFSPGGGSYSGQVSVAMSSATSGATIRYTKDGSTPTSASTAYTGPVLVNSMTTLKAAAYMQGMADSAVTTAAYTIANTPAKPNATNTGYSGTLTPAGGMTITANGTVIENKHVTGTIHIKANNVTIRNCLIQTGGYYGINCNYNGYTGLLIENCEIRDMTGAGVYGGNFTARRLKVHNSGNDAFVATVNFVIESCYMYNLGYISTSHADGIQMIWGGNGIIRWNNIDMPHDQPGYNNSQCIIIQSGNGPIDDILIHENWINGGGFSVQIRDKGYGDPTNVVITNNKFGRDYQYGIRVLDGNVVWTGNVWEDNGQPAP